MSAAEARLRSAAITQPSAERAKEAQRTLLRGINKLSEKIVDKFPPNRFSYVGLGRSPTAVIASLQNARLRGQIVPLSSFRPAHSVPSITDEVLMSKDAERLTPQQRERLFAHFESNFPKRPERNEVLLIDYTQSAKSLVAGQEQLQAFFQHKGWDDIKVHALALARPGQAGYAELVGEQIGTSKVSDWFVSRVGDRAQFKAQWHAMSLTEGPYARTSEEAALESLFSRQGTDAFGQSYKVLEEGAERPEPIRDAPGATSAYTVLREALDEGYQLDKEDKRQATA
ncbi:hypothetical protein OOT46_09175 [Aquabacterium sp. A7-Y]|uniref:hypothetical protein n=1 Tax=Aquabacterium sp. A7-Y TaxID=1349605 RepID=UPI00223D5367|nr:hypothetical protein [Aquabacterium sp. A7-Y]MCW7538019.1 hypothetical protein [Aquabacterium sp. A7-Y]